MNNTSINFSLCDKKLYITQSVSNINNGICIDINNLDKKQLLQVILKLIDVCSSIEEK